mgnify:CR=1 FL=1
MNTAEINSQEIEKLLAKVASLKEEVAKVIVGQQQAVEELLICLLAGGHGLLEGVPGLAKTLLVRSIAQVIDASFRRIQFTPDLMPGDILGTEMLEEDQISGKKFFKFNQGPIFANIILADEINRTPPKTQAALLEAMQEFSVSYAGQHYELPRPFFILATQNPIEQAGTYPLPEAQLDRFLLYIKIGYPSEAEELDILAKTTGKSSPSLDSRLATTDILQLQSLVKQVFIASDLLEYTNHLVRNTRPQYSKANIVKEYVAWGAGVRAGQALVLCAKARALLQGRFAVQKSDLQAIAFPALRHRILMNFSAEAAQISADEVVAALI